MPATLHIGEDKKPSMITSTLELAPLSCLRCAGAGVQQEAQDREIREQAIQLSELIHIVERCGVLSASHAAIWRRSGATPAEDAARRQVCTLGGE